jgi:hypothetical protein
VLLPRRASLIVAGVGELVFDLVQPRDVGQRLVGAARVASRRFPPVAAAVRPRAESRSPDPPVDVARSGAAFRRAPGVAVPLPEIFADLGAERGGVMASS